MGEVCLIPEGLKCCLGQRQVLLRPRKDVCGEYLYWALQSPFVQHQIAWNEGTGTTVSNVRIPVLKSLEIPRLGHHESGIANTLSCIAGKIQLNHQINQTLEQMAQAIFKSWFVNFEPVKAKIAARERWHALQPGNEPASPVCYAGELDGQPIDVDLDTYMNLAAMQAISGSSLYDADASAAGATDQLAQMQAEQPEQYAELYATAELFPSAMQESELGEIPEGWEVKRLSETIQLIGGGTPKKSEPNYWGGDICWFSVKDTPADGNIWVIDTDEKITQLGLDSSSTRLLPIGTTIITARGTVGKLALTGVTTAMNQSCYGVVGEDGAGPFLNYMRLTQAIEVLKRNTHGAVFDTITRDTFSTVTQVSAPQHIKDRFETLVSPSFLSIKANLQSSTTLSALRDTLLPKLLSGELTLPDTEEPQTELQVVAHV